MEFQYLPPPLLLSSSSFSQNIFEYLLLIHQIINILFILSEYFIMRRNTFFPSNIRSLSKEICVFHRLGRRKANKKKSLQILIDNILSLRTVFTKKKNAHQTLFYRKFFVRVYFFANLYSPL